MVSLVDAAIMVACADGGVTPWSTQATIIASIIRECFSFTVVFPVIAR